MAYNEITRRLFGEKFQELERERQPSFVLGTPTKRMLALHKRYKAAHEEMTSCETSLKRLGVRADGNDLTLHYNREKVLRDQWQRRHKERIDAVKAIRTQAQIDLLDMPAKAAKPYLLKLRKKLAAI